LSQPSNLINEAYLQADSDLFASNSFSESSELHIERHDIGISGIPENGNIIESSQFASSSLDDSVLNRGNENGQDPVHRSESLDESSEVDIVFTSSRPRKGIPLDESLYDATAATATSNQGLSNSLPDDINEFVILDVDLDGSLVVQREEINEPCNFEEISQDKSDITYIKDDVMDSSNDLGRKFFNEVDSPDKSNTDRINDFSDIGQINSNQFFNKEDDVEDPDRINS
jgi:hypothetical protein